MLANMSEISKKFQISMEVGGKGVKFFGITSKVLPNQLSGDWQDQ